ncbi:MAG: hypothetical protein K0U39_03300 [Alphaproteobacteria bacterium]|nr:hypothetical protein [Alphaproteobacteria bacterium]
MQQASSHRFHESLFHEDHIRGIVGETLRLEDAYFLGKILGTIARHENAHRAIIGYDGRPSSQVLEKELARGLVTTGMKVMNVGLASPAMLWFLEDEMQPELVIMIGGGGNIGGGDHSAQQNGFRIKMNGKIFASDELKRIPKIGLTGNWRSLDGGSYIAGHADIAYTKRLLTSLTLTNPDLSAIWCSDSALANVIFPQMLPALNGTHHNITPASDDTLDALLKKTVLERQASIGFGIDSYHENLHMADDKGRVIDPDRILPVMLEYITYGAALAGKKILLDITASRTITTYLSNQGATIEFFNGGHMLWHQKMLSGDYILGASMDGHYYFDSKQFYGSDDLFFTAFKMLEICEKFNPISAKIDIMPYSVISPIERINIVQQTPLIYLDAMTEIVNQYQPDAELIRHENYLMVSQKKGWYIILANQADSNLTMRAEAETRDNFNHIRSDMLNLLRNAKVIK